jgi:hypothetical protein
VIVNNKETSLLCYGIFYGREKFYDTGFGSGGTTLSTTTFSITTLSETIKNRDTRHSNPQHNGTHTVMLSVANKPTSLSVVLLNVVMLSVVAPLWPVLETYDDRK